MSEITANPLYWPDGWHRANYREHSRFGKWNAPVTISKSVLFVLDQLRIMGIPDYMVIISSDLKLRNDGLPYSSQKTPDDPGVSVWWQDEDGNQQVIALDKYSKIEDNLWAIGKTIEALRGIKRWGGGEILNRAFKGFAALPNPDNRSWKDVLGHDIETLAQMKSRYQRMARENHPDHGGDQTAMSELNWAREQAKQALGTQA